MQLLLGSMNTQICSSSILRRRRERKRSKNRLKRKQKPPPDEEVRRQHQEFLQRLNEATKKENEAKAKAAKPPPPVNPLTTEKCLGWKVPDKYGQRVKELEEENRVPSKPSAVVQGQKLHSFSVTSKKLKKEAVSFVSGISFA